MVFFLASLPSKAYDYLKIVHKKYREGKLKGQHIPRSKKGTVAKPPDIKGSKFKCLRGVTEDVVCRLLQELSEGKLTLLEMSSECSSVKQLQKVQSAFIKGTNCTSWDDAKEKYPMFTTAEQLEPFKHMSFPSSKLPDSFLKFCHRAIQ